METPAWPTDNVDEVWTLAQPIHLLELLVHYGVTGAAIAGRLGVAPPMITIWKKGRQKMPARHGPPLLPWAQTVHAEKLRVLQKDLAAAGSDEERDALRASVLGPWALWRLRVRADAGSIADAIRVQGRKIGEIAVQRTYTHRDYLDLELCAEVLLTNVRLQLRYATQEPQEPGEGEREES